MNEDSNEIPEQLIINNKDEFYMWILIYIQGLIFFIIINIGIKFRTMQYIPDRSDKTILEAIDNIFCIYNKGGFNIKEIHADPEFNKIDSNIMDELDIIFNPAPT